MEYTSQDIQDLYERLVALEKRAGYRPPEGCHVETKPERTDFTSSINDPRQDRMDCGGEKKGGSVKDYQVGGAVMVWNDTTHCHESCDVVDVEERAITVRLGRDMIRLVMHDGLFESQREETMVVVRRLPLTKK